MDCKRNVKVKNIVENIILALFKFEYKDKEFMIFGMTNEWPD